MWLWVLAAVGGIFWWSGYSVVRKQMGEFPNITAGSRLLVVAPHPDDEILMAGGLMQEVKARGGKVKVVYLTSGDGSRGTVAWESRNVIMNPEEFLALGRKRMKEAGEAMQVLGFSHENMIFLGFPDRGLAGLLNRNWEESDGLGISPTTKYNHVPYENCLVPNQSYLGKNLVADLENIIRDFDPTWVVTTHPRDEHPDHRAAYEAVTKVKELQGGNWKIWAEVIHYRDFPDGKSYLSPPRKLFGGDWVSWELSDQELKTKTQAIGQYQSQVSVPMEKKFFTGFETKNEIFEQE